MYQFLDKTFELAKNNTTVRKELAAGFITFLTMSYILIVNPNILSAAGMDKDALFTATALAAIVGTLLMGLLAKLPVAQAPGMGLNSFFAFTIVVSMGYTWQFALTAVFIEGLIFILLTFFNVREIIVKSIPKVLKDAIPVGIGIYITLIGLKQAEFIVGNENTLVSMGDLANHSIWIAFAGLLVTAVLLIRKVNGAILIGILTATAFGFVLGDVSLPQSSWITLPPSIEPIFGKAIEPLFTKEGLDKVLSLDMAIVVFTLLFVNLFDTVGTLIGVVSRMNITDKDGNFPQLKKALFADALATTAGSIIGVSTITSYIESASGVTAGGRTGLTAVGVALAFVAALFLSPIFLMVPAAATTPALIIVGLFMISSIVKINFDDITESLPAFITILFMPFTYSIAMGIVFGILSFTLIKLLSGRTKDITLTVYIVSLIFLIKLILDAIHILG